MPLHADLRIKETWGSLLLQLKRSNRDVLPDEPAVLASGRNGLAHCGSGI